jgi:hypothetical protein
VGFDGATVLGVGLVVGGLGLLVTAVAGLSRRYGLFHRRRRRRVRVTPPHRPQGTERPIARRDVSRSNANMPRTNPASRPRAGEPRLAGNERPRPIVDPRRFPASQPAPIQSATPARLVPIRPDAAAADTVLLQPVPAWSQPAPAILRDPPRNDPPRADLITMPIAHAAAARPAGARPTGARPAGPRPEPARPAPAPAALPVTPRAVATVDGPTAEVLVQPAATGPLARPSVGTVVRSTAAERGAD